MNPFGLYLTGGAVSAAAFTVALHTDGRFQDGNQAARDFEETGRQNAVSETGVSSHAPPPVPKRSVKSRTTDVSMATRLRPEKTVTVGGMVTTPGPVSFRNQITLEEAIQQAGGATEFGSLRRVRIFRDGHQKSYDLTDERFRRIPLEAGDTVEVPPKIAVGR